MNRLPLLVLPLLLLLSVATAKQCAQENVLKLKKFKIEQNCKREEGEEGYSGAPGKSVRVTVSLEEKDLFVPSSLILSLDNVKEVKVRCTHSDKTKSNDTAKEPGKQYHLDFKKHEVPTKRISITARAENKSLPAVIKFKKLVACFFVDTCAKKGGRKFEDFITEPEPQKVDGNMVFTNPPNRRVKIFMKLDKEAKFIPKKLELSLTNVKKLQISLVSPRTGKTNVKVDKPGDKYELPLKDKISSLKEISIIAEPERKTAAEIRVKKLDACVVAQTCEGNCLTVDDDSEEQEEEQEEEEEEQELEQEEEEEEQEEEEEDKNKGDKDKDKDKNKGDKDKDKDKNKGDKDKDKDKNKGDKDKDKDKNKGDKDKDKDKNKGDKDKDKDKKKDDKEEDGKGGRGPK